MKKRKDYSHIITLIREDNQRELYTELPKLMEHISASVLKGVSGFSFDEIYGITNSLYLTVYEKISSGRIRNNKTLLSYYYTTVRNRCFSISKKKTTLVGDLRNPLMLYSDDNIPLSIISEEEGPADQIDQEDRSEQLYEAISNLPQLQRDVINLFLEFPGISSKDGAQLLGINDTNFRISKYRALKELKRTLSKEYVRTPQPAI